MAEEYKVHRSNKYRVYFDDNLSEEDMSVDFEMEGEYTVQDVDEKAAEIAELYYATHYEWEEL